MAEGLARAGISNRMTTTLESSFLRAVCLMVAFKPEKMVRAQAALLLIGLEHAEFTAADLPGEITEGSRHIAGASCGALVAMELLTVTRRIKSPDPKAKGRKLDVFTLASRERARAWLRSNGVAMQQELELAL